MIIKKIMGKIHLWLGLASGLLVFIISITGCIYAFQEEIQDFVQPYRFIEPQNKPFLFPSELEKIAGRELPGKHAHSVVYKKKAGAAQVVFYNADPAYYYLVFLNPYNGEVLEVKNMEEDFFRFILMGHFYLWLPPAIGQPVAASATLIFVILLVTGMILWWPKNKNGVKQRFTIKWNGRWRRRNYDLHNVLGFYIAGLVVILALTGLVWGFEWFARTVYWTASQGKEMVKYYDAPSDTTNRNRQDSSLAVDKVWKKMKAENSTAESIEVHFPENDKVAIAANANPDDGTYWQTDFRYFDQHTLKEVAVTHSFGRYKEATAADKLMRMNYDIHVGAILGLPGKILAFFASLIAASFPVTGFCIWWGRKNKTSKKKVKPKKIKHRNFIPRDLKPAKKLYEREYR